MDGLATERAVGLFLLLLYSTKANKSNGVDYFYPTVYTVYTSVPRLVDMTRVDAQNSAKAIIRGPLQ